MKIDLRCGASVTFDGSAIKLQSEKGDEIHLSAKAIDLLNEGMEKYKETKRSNHSESLKRSVISSLSLPTPACNGDIVYMVRMSGQIEHIVWSDNDPTLWNYYMSGRVFSHHAAATLWKASFKNLWKDL